MSTRQRMSALILSAAIAVAALAAPTADAAPAAAAGCGDSTFAGESAFVTLQPGETAQFSVLFQNTGTCTWTVGASTQVNLAQGLPLGSPSPNSCWGVGWLSTTAYTTTTQTSVAPGSIGTFAYQIKAPANVPPGSYRFDGDLVLASTGAALNPQGYFQIATVPQPTGAILGGKVTAEASGAAVANASVQVHQTSAVMAGNGMPFTSTTTDGCGYYTVGRTTTLPAGSYRVGFFPAASANLFHEYHQDVYQLWAGADASVTSGSTTLVNAALSPIRTITGSAKTSAGAGVANTQVSIYDVNAPCTIPSNSCGQIVSAITSSTGAFTASVPRGDFHILFSPPAGLGHGDEWWKNGPPLTVASTQVGNASGIDLVFRPTVNGKVTAPSGAALAESVAVRVYVNSGGTCVQVGIVHAHPFNNGSYAIPLNATPSATLYAEARPFAGSTLPTEWWQEKTSCALANPISWTGTSVGGINFTLP